MKRKLSLFLVCVIVTFLIVTPVIASSSKIIFNMEDYPGMSAQEIWHEYITAKDGIRIAPYRLCEHRSSRSVNSYPAFRDSTYEYHYRYTDFYCASDCGKYLSTRPTLLNKHRINVACTYRGPW